MYKFKAYKCPDYKKSDIAIAPISIGNSKFEGQKVCDYLDWLSRQYGSLYLKISDINKRHNYVWMDSLKEEEAYNTALQGADEWLKKYSDVIEKYNNMKVIRLSDYYNTPELKEIISLYEALARKNKQFREALIADSSDYIDRWSHGDFPYDKIIDLCIKYRVEEIALDTLLMSHDKMAYLYFDKEILSRKFIRGTSDPKFHLGMENSYHVHIKSRVKKSFKQDNNEELMKFLGETPKERD